MCPRWLLLYIYGKLPAAGFPQILDNVKELFCALDFFVGGRRGVL